jgi:hypothetical protein
MTLKSKQRTPQKLDLKDLKKFHQKWFDKSFGQLKLWRWALGFKPWFEQASRVPKYSKKKPTT